MADSVLAHLALRLAAHPENIATEALAYVLGRSGHACRALASSIATVGFSVADDVRYVTQAREDSGGQPDLAATRPDGTLQLLVEAKFWAGLTENQPLGYLRMLPASPSLLLFVAPARRMETLWPEITRRAANFAIGGAIATPRATLRSQRFGPHHLALTSWTDLLSQILTATDAAGEAETSADVRQLLALCEQMDADAFLPFLSDELTSSIGRRIIQFGDLASDLTQALVDKGLANVKGMRASGANGWFGRYLLLRGHGAFLHFSAWRWANWGESPLWLEVKSPQWKVSAEVSARLAEASIPFRESESGAQVPLVLPLGVERDKVMAAALLQLERVAQCLPTPEGPPGPPPQDDGADNPTAG